MSGHQHSTEFADEIDDLKLSPYAFRLYMHIKRVYDETGQGCHETTHQLARVCDMSVGKISESKNELINAGLLIINKSLLGTREVDDIIPLEYPSPDAKRFLTPAYIYLIYCATGHYKIGLSKEPEKRLLQLNTAWPVELSLVHFFVADNAQEAEARLHAHYSAKRVKGEWFDLSQEQVAFIKSITSYQDGVFNNRK